MRPAPLSAKSSLRSPRTPETDSPTLGRGPGFAALADQVRKKQHLMLWSRYDDGAAKGSGGMVVPRTPPSASQVERGEVSPDTTGTVRDSTFVVSPMGSLDRR